MRDWIVGLQKAAKKRGTGLDPMRWFKLEGGVNAVPDELRDLYEAFDGATLPPDVTLFPFFSESGTQGVVERSLEEPGWTFGEKNGQPLLTARKRELKGQTLPDWAAFLSEEEWIYALRLASGEYRYYRNLEQMLSRMVPPAQTEEFGDLTYAHALSAVEGILGNLVEAPKTAKKAVAKKKAPPKKKAVAQKAPAKKKAAKKVAAKKKPVKPSRKMAKRVAQKPKKAPKPVKKNKKTSVKKKASR